MNQETTPTESSKKVFIVYCETTEKINFENEEILISMGKGESYFFEKPYIECTWTSHIPKITKPENIFAVYSESKEMPRFKGDTLAIPTGDSSPKIINLESHFLIEKIKEMFGRKKGA